MEIRIDTCKDSKEEIRKAIRFLQGLVESETGGQDLPSSGENMMGGIFDLPATEDSPENLPPSKGEDTEMAEPQPIRLGEEAKKRPKESMKYDGFEVY